MKRTKLATCLGAGAKVVAALVVPQGSSSKVIAAGRAQAQAGPVGCNLTHYQASSG